VRSVAVVVLDVLTDDGFEMATTEDEHPVQTFTPDSADEALSEGGGTGSPDRSANGPDTFGTEDLVEASRELGVAIPDQELDRACTLGEFMGQAPGSLDLWVPRTPSGTLNWTYFQSGCDRENGPWPSRSSTSSSSGLCRSSACNGPTTPIWPPRWQCSDTRWLSFVVKWPAPPYDLRTERSLPASAG
jgi:hypothetical protein